MNVEALKVKIPIEPARAVALMDTAIVGIGHNNAPEPTPFDISREEIEPLFAEAKNWADGTPVQTQEQADSVGKLIGWLRDAGKRADERRKAENKPFDDGKADVQARYNLLIQPKNGKVDLAIDACKKAMQPFFDRKEAEQREIADRARALADAKRREADEAMRKSKADDLAAREAAEAKLREAKVAEKQANREEAVKIGAKGGARMITATTRYVAKLSDRGAAARFFWQECPDQFDDLLGKLGQDCVDAGRRDLPGFTVSEDRSVR